LLGALLNAWTTKYVRYVFDAEGRRSASNCGTEPGFIKICEVTAAAPDDRVVTRNT